MADMEIDPDAINLALHRFFLNEYSVKGLITDEDQKYISLIAPTLDIALVELTRYKNLSSEHAGAGKESNKLYFSGEIADKGDGIIIREVMADGSVLTMSAYHPQNTDWQEGIQLYVRHFLTALLIIKGRYLLTEQVSYATNYDLQFGIHSQNYAMKLMTILIQKNEIEQYTGIFFNIRNMAGINALLGREQGTIVLHSYIKKIQDCLGENETVWRIGGDNFGAIIHRTHLPCVTELLQGADIFFSDTQNDRVRISSWAGLYNIDSKVKTCFEIMDAISASMYIAKNSLRIPLLFYDERTIRMVEHSKKIETSFEDALRNNEFTAYYQPKVSLKTYTLTGAESLCRWQKENGIVPPDSFIPILERSKKICNLDFYMLEKVCTDLQHWIEQKIEPVRVSVNFSRKHLGNTDFVRHVLSILDAHRVPHNMIIAEFTETTNAADFERLKEVVAELRDNGIEVSVDDFGMGYSSMSLIRDVQFNELKIDKSFLEGSQENSSRKHIMMKHVIGMANELGMSVITEGVETTEQIEMLKELGCFYGQGFFFDRPLPYEQFSQRLKSKNYNTNRSA